MKKNPVKRNLLQGGVSIGTMVLEFNTNGIGRIAVAAGAEFIIFDMEHTGWSVETIGRLIATTPVPELIPIVRIPATEYHFIARVLDVGAMGVMVPMVESEEQAKTIVEFAKYPPLGRRGAAFGLAQDDYKMVDLNSTITRANQEQLLIAQIETREGLEELEKIASVADLDVLWIGHFDLTNSLGIPGQFDHPMFREAMDRVLDACRRHEKIAGFLASDAENGKWLFSLGFRMLALGDLWTYQQALAEQLSEIQAVRE